MANRDSKERTGIPLAGIVAVLLFLTGTAVKYLPMETFRPKGTDIQPLPCESAQDIDARMWQDPFAVAKRHFDARKAEDPAESDKRAFMRLQGEIGATLVTGDVTILAVMTLPGFHSENAEHLRRMRFAVLSGLSKTGYVPKDEWHIGYIHDFVPSADLSPRGCCHAPWKPHLAMGTWGLLPILCPDLVWPSSASIAGAFACPTRSSPGVAQLIPYEWYLGSKKVSPRNGLAQGKGSEGAGPAVLVLWLSEEALNEQPLIKLHAILRMIWPGGNVSQGSARKPKFVVLGPASATMLEKMVQPQHRFCEEGANRNKCRTEDPCAKVKSWSQEQGVKFYSALAGLDSPSAAWQKFTDEPCDLAALFKSRLLAIPHSPVRLCEALLDELKLRYAYPGGNGTDTTSYIALIADWDTLAGRRLPQAFIAAMTNRSIPGKLALRFNYLRGLAGDTDTVKTGDKDGAKEASKTKGFSQSVNLSVLAEGTSQRDYVKRLAASLDKSLQEIEKVKNNEKHRVVAIGLLGSDPQDKLLLLEEMRPRFQDVVFFTTDLDARLLDASVKKWTRNLVVVSSFGLELHEKWQGPIPPFRDSQQSATFMATQLALTDSTATAEGSDGSFWQNMPPRVFEIGRTHAVDLSPPFDGALSPIHPAVPEFHLEWNHVQMLKLFGMCLLIFLLMIVAFYPWFEKYFLVHWRCNTAVLVVIIALVMAGFYLFKKLYNQVPFRGEPLLWLEGVSVWPSECMRLLACILSIWFIYLAQQKVGRDTEELERDYELKVESSEPKSDQDDQRGIGRIIKEIRKAVRRFCSVQFMLEILDPFHLQNSEKDKVVKAQNLFNWYVGASRARHRCLRVAAIVFVYFAFGAMLFSLGDMPLRPLRGSLSKGIDFIMVFLSVLASNILLLFIADISRVSSAMLRKLRIGGATEWPEDLYRSNQAKLRDIFQDFQVATSETQPIPDPKLIEASPKRQEYTEVINDFIDFEFVADHTERISRLIWYPVLPLTLILAARVNIFDNWLFWPPLVIILSISSLIVLGCAYELQRSAEDLRDNAIENLSEKLVYAKGKPEFGHRAAQIEALLQWIRSVKKGAFLPFFERPLVRSILVSLSSFGGISILEYFSFCA